MAKDTPLTEPRPAGPLSIDQLKANRWRMSESNGFVVRDYTGLNAADPEAEPMVVVLKSSELWDYLADAAVQKRKISIYVIGERLLDWSA